MARNKWKHNFTHFSGLLKKFTHSRAFSFSYLRALTHSSSFLSASVVKAVKKWLITLSVKFPLHLSTIPSRPDNLSRFPHRMPYSLCFILLYLYSAALSNQSLLCLLRSLHRRDDEVEEGRLEKGSSAFCWICEEKKTSLHSLARSRSLHVELHSSSSHYRLSRSMLATSSRFSCHSPVTERVSFAFNPQLASVQEFKNFNVKWKNYWKHFTPFSLCLLCAHSNASFFTISRRRVRCMELFSAFEFLTFDTMQIVGYARAVVWYVRQFNRKREEVKGWKRSWLLKWTTRSTHESQSTHIQYTRSLMTGWRNPHSFLFFPSFFISIKLNDNDKFRWNRWNNSK